jgi:hypothetical protein
MELPTTLRDEIWDYCRANNISNIDDFVLKMVKQGFTMEKYGATPIPRVESQPVPPSPVQEEPSQNKTEKRNDLYGEGN